MGNSRNFEIILEFIRSLYPNETPVPLHAPRFFGNEKKYLNECIDSTYVSYVGRFVTEFEEQIKRFTGARNAVAMVNGTAALQMMLIAAGVKPGDAVITQDLTFAATAAGICHAGAQPVFVDIDKDTLGMSPESLQEYFLTSTKMDSNNSLLDIKTGRRISAVVPMHTFGHPVRINEIIKICNNYGIQVLEDAAEALSSFFDGTHMGLFGRAAILSFNGNKPITTGGGGMLISNDDSLAERARFLSTTAKRKHRWEFFHDEVGYNLRMPNINAAIGSAQMENANRIFDDKRVTAALYDSFFSSIGIPFFRERDNCKANYWLNAILLDDKSERDAFLEYSNDHEVQTRPVWTLMHKLPPYANCVCKQVPNAEWVEDRLVNIPSSMRV